MTRSHLAIGSLAALSVAASSLALLIDPGPIDRTAVFLIVVGLAIATLTTLTGLLLARAPWGRWGLLSLVIGSAALGAIGSSSAMWLSVGLTGFAAVGLLGPWLGLWTRHHRLADAPGPVVVALISVAAVATLYVGLSAASGADWSHWVASFVAVASSVLFGRGFRPALWLLRAVVPAAALLAATHTAVIGGIAIAAGGAVVSVLAWLPEAKQSTAVITPPLPSPIQPRSS